MVAGNTNAEGLQNYGPSPALKSPDGLVGTLEKSDPGEAGAVDGHPLAGRREWTQDGEEMVYGSITGRVEDR